MLKLLFSATVLSIACACALTPKASANLLQNPSFETATYSGSASGITSANAYGQFGSRTGSQITLSNWTTSGYNFVFTAGTVSAGTQAAGANGTILNETTAQYNLASDPTQGNTYMWGLGTSTATRNTTLAASPNAKTITASPDLGRFLVLDGDGNTGNNPVLAGAVTQTGIAITTGGTYRLTYYRAAAQQEGFNGATTEQVSVTLTKTSTGTAYTSTQASSVINLPEHSFSGWVQETIYFKIDPIQTGTFSLSFLAIGTPNGQPPFTLLDGADLVQLVPEASHWAVFAGFGAFCIGFKSLRKAKRSAAA